MTEIPEHLLARSKARRQAIGQDEGAAPSDAPATGAAVEKAAPAGAAAAPAGPSAAAAGIAPSKAPAPPTPPPAPPKRPEVLAAESRKKIPGWAVPAVVGLPLWAFLYAFTLEPPAQGLSPALEEGHEIYTAQGCAGCHGPAGGGGIGPAFTAGAVVETFSDYEDHARWVTLGSNGWRQEVGATYGDTDKPVNGGMPDFGGKLSEEEILLVVRYEREVLAGHGCEPGLAEATGEECAPGTEAEGAAEGG